jgi:DNA segregation ATPase FtsK/SpoIIIE, S-DNA-T family
MHDRCLSTTAREALARAQARPVLLTIAPFDDVEVAEGITVAQLRSHLAAATGRPELRSAPLTVDGSRLEPTQVCGHEPLLAGAIVHSGPSRPDAARAAVRAAWHLAVTDGPDAGHLVGPGPGGSIVLRGTAPLARRRSRSAPERSGAAALVLGDGLLTEVEVRVRATRLWTQVRWRTGPRRWHPWLPGRDLAVGASRLELRWRPDREPARWRRRRTGGDAPERRRARTATTSAALLPLVSSVALAIALRSAALLVIGLASAAALALTRRLDDHRNPDDSPRSGRAAAEPSTTATGASLVAGAEPAELARWLAGPPRDAVWSGPLRVLDHPRERCLGIVGPADRTRATVRAIVAAAVARSEPGLLELAVVGPRATAADWGWARWLPATVHLAEDSLPNALVEPAHRLPLLCVADGPLGTSAATGLADWWHRSAAGSWLILLLDRADERPAWCHSFLDVAAGAWVTADGTTRPTGTPGVSTAWAESVARRLLGRRRLLGGADRAHRPVPLTALPGLPRVDSAAISAGWETVGKPGAPELRAPIGTTADGRPLVLELSRDGPHVLIAGTTGAGKSELLQSLVISLAAQRSPAELAFALVDFKGGASLGPCVRLPHVTGRVSDLDPLLARRAVSGLRAELRRREAILARCGVADLDALWLRHQDGGALPPGAPDPGEPGLRAVAPPPRLVIVVDELRALVDDVPEAMPTIARIAAQGRALGMHLVLATQRPAGALSADARANIGIRIALRVADPADSLDVLGIPDAADIPHDHPGQALLRVAAATPVPFQTALAGGHAPDPAVARLVGSTSVPETPADRSSPDQGWVAAVSAAFDSTALPRPAPLWQPPLPERVDLGDLVGGAPSADEGVEGLVWGLADLVDEQRQGHARWHPAHGSLVVLGRGGAGRTTALRTLAVSALRAGRPVHVISATPWHFADLADREAFGTLAAAGDGRLAHRLLDLLRRELSAGLAARGNGPGGPPTHPSEMPPLLVLDDLPDLVRTLEARSRSAVEVLGAVVRASSGSGLAIAASAAPGSLGRELAAHLPQRLVLAAGDATAAVADGVPRALAGVPVHPGRGVWLAVQPAVLTQVAQATTDPLCTFAPPIAPPGAGTRRAPVRLRPLPADAGTPPVGGRATTSPALGRGGDFAEPVTVDLSDGCFLAVGPPRSGRSTTLAVLAAALLEQGAETLIVARRGPLLTLARSGVGARTTLTDRPTTDHLAHAGLIVLDDLDDLERRDPDWIDAVCARRLTERTPGPIVLASATTERAALSFRGLLGELRRAGCGVVLGADAPGSGEVFSTRIEAYVDDHADRPGRGVLLDRAGAVPLQVFRTP